MNCALGVEGGLACVNYERRVLEKYVTLPTGPVPLLDNVFSTRAAEALVMYSTSSDGDISTSEAMCGANVIIFLHGFSQHPCNYRTLLHSLAQDSDGAYVIVAPIVSIGSVILPWQHVETTDMWASPASKLQSAIVIDAARATQLAFEACAARIHLLGHSLGGMAGLALAAQAPSAFSSVIALAPAVHTSVNTHVNQMVTKDAFDGGMDQFCTHAKAVPVLLVHGEKDNIVTASKSQDLFETISNRSEDAVSILAMVHNGTHVGMEDCLDLCVHIPGVELVAKAAVALADLHLFHNDNSQRTVQLPATMSLLRAWLNASPEARKDPNQVVSAVARAAGTHVVTLSSSPAVSQELIDDDIA